MLHEFNKYPYKIDGRISKERKRKQLIAIVYDFLKRNYIMSEFLESCEAVHGKEVKITIKPNERPLMKYIERAVDRVINKNNPSIFRDMFYDSTLTFNFSVANGQYHNLWVEVDRIWTNIIDNNKSLIIQGL
jgi:hypothetical protein